MSHMLLPADSVNYESSDTDYEKATGAGTAAAAGGDESRAAAATKKVGTCKSAVCVRIKYQSNQKRCAELQIPHSNPQTH